MTIERSQVKAPVLPKKAVDVPAIGGEVIVRGLLLSDRIALWDLSKARAGETDDQANARAEGYMVVEILARAVVLDDGLPLWTSAQWNEFASTHSDEALRLSGIAQRLSGGDTKAIEKN